MYILNKLIEGDNVAKKISEKIVIGNALYTVNRGYLTKQQIYHYYHIVDNLLPDGYYTLGNNNSFSNFCEEYPFLVKRIEDKMIINCDRDLLARYCRMGVPKELIEVFDIAGNKLIEEKGKILAKSKCIKKY